MYGPALNVFLNVSTELFSCRRCLSEREAQQHLLGCCGKARHGSAALRSWARRVLACQKASWQTPINRLWSCVSV